MHVKQKRKLKKKVNKQKKTLIFKHQPLKKKKYRPLTQGIFLYLKLK